MKRILSRLQALLLAGILANGLSAQQWDGLTYYSNQNTTLGYLLDTNGVAVKTWTFTGGTGYSTHLMPGGTIWRSVLNPGNVLVGGGMHGRIQKVDYSGTLLWDFAYSSSAYCLHHDHCPLPNGNVLVICYEVRTPSEVIAAGGSTAITVWSEKIMELQPVGTNSANVVWEWKLWDHLVQDVDPNAANYQSSIVDNPQLMNINYMLKKDWIHMNGIDYNPLLDQIVVSSHNINEWYIIDHSTTTAEAASHSGGLAGKGGDFLYRWGNPAAYNATGPKILNVTHDSHWIPENCPNGGNLAGLNNKGVSSTTPYKSTADQAIIPRVGYNYSLTPGNAYLPSSYSSRVVGYGYTSNMGSTQEFPNGNTLFCLAINGYIYEADPTGKVIWSKSTGGFTSQSKRYSECYLTGGATPQPTVTVQGYSLTSTGATTYQWYVDGYLIPGATAQTHNATKIGRYVVKVTDVNNCDEAYSAAVTVTVAAPVDTTGVSSHSFDSMVSIHPNPSTGVIHVNVPSSTFSVDMRDGAGRLVSQTVNSQTIDASALENGLYFLTITSEDGKVATRKITILK